MSHRLWLIVPAALVTGLMLGACSTPEVTTDESTTATPTVPVSTTTITTITTISTAPPTVTSAPPTTTVPPLDRADEAAMERMRADLEAVLAVGPRVAGSPAELAAADRFAADVEAITGEPVEVEQVPLPNGEMSQNVWAADVGSSERVLVLGAHLDSVEGSPGADDNGSGVVVLLELLRRLADEPPVDLRVVVVGFGAEEVLPGMGADDHHFGSRLAAERLAAEDALPDWMVSVDMVGLGERLMAVAYLDTDPSLATEIATAGAAAGVEVSTLSRGDISDHEAFARQGVPSAFLWRPDNPAWHTADDDTVDDDALLEDLAVLEALILRLAEGPTP